MEDDDGEAGGLALTQSDVQRIDRYLMKVVDLGRAAHGIRAILSTRAGEQARDARSDDDDINDVLRFLGHESAGPALSARDAAEMRRASISLANKCALRGSPVQSGAALGRFAEKSFEDGTRPSIAGEVDMVEHAEVHGDMKYIQDIMAVMGEMAKKGSIWRDQGMIDRISESTKPIGAFTGQIFKQDPKSDGDRKSQEEFMKRLVHADLESMKERNGRGENPAVVMAGDDIDEALGGMMDGVLDDSVREAERISERAGLPQGED